MISSIRTGKLPARHAWICAVAARSAWRLSFASARQVEHCGGHLDILTSFVCQSISGLCSRSQVKPRIMLCLPNEVTANWMAFVAQNDVRDLGDSAGLIRSSIDVVDRDRRREATGGEVVQTDILSVDEEPSSATVDECHEMMSPPLFFFSFHVKTYSNRTPASLSFF